MNNLKVSNIMRNQAEMIGEAKKALNEIIETAKNTDDKLASSIKETAADALKKMRDHAQNTEDLQRH